MIRVAVAYRPAGPTGGDTSMAKRYAVEIDKRADVAAIAIPADEVDASAYDVIHLWPGCSPEWGLSLAVRAKDADKVLMVTPLYWPRDARLKYNGQAGDVYPGYKHQIAAILNLADVLTCVTMGEAVECWKMAPQKPVVIIGCGVDVPMAPAAPDTIGNYVVCVGRVERHKNQANIARACKALGVPLNCIGPTPDMDYAAEVTAWGGHVLGEMDHSATLEAIARARVHVNASFGEIVCQATLEAAALDVPCVISLIGADPSYFGPGAHYCQPDDWRDIRDAIVGAWRQEERHWFKPSTTWHDVAQVGYDWMVNHV